MSEDLVIVGAGPAGIAAALAARAEGASPLLVEAEPAPGGQLHRVFSRVTGWPGFDGAGAELASAWSAELEAARVRLRTGVPVASLEFAPGGEALLGLVGADPVRARRVLVTTGLRPRRLGVPGEAELAGRGVSTSATRDRARFAGREVVVVGGGDAAFENALLLAEAGCRVRLLVRGAPRARGEFRDRVREQPRIVVESGVRVLAILGEDRVRGVRIARGSEPVEVAAEAVFVKAGSEPATEWCQAAIRCDAQGFVIAGAGGATSAPGTHAAGDVLGPPSFTIARAVESARAAVAALRPGGTSAG